MSDRRMDAYYYGFEPTGDDAIDKILGAVACAGKAYHHTDCWNDETQPYEDHTGRNPNEWIQNAANEAAEVKRLRGQGWQPAPKTARQIDFGDYVNIEMKRYGADNEFYLHKVVGRLQSSHAAVVPIDQGLDTGSGTDQRSLGEVQDVLNVIQCGVSETHVFKVAVKDVTPLPSPPINSKSD